MDDNRASVKSMLAAGILLDTRKDSGLTLNDLSEKTGISETYISLLERNERPISKKNFFTIFKDGFGYDDQFIASIWERIVADGNSQRNIISKAIASSKYKVRALGLNAWHDESESITHYSIGCRWTMAGSIYQWKFWSDDTNYLKVHYPLKEEKYDSNWQTVLNKIGKEEALLLLNAILDEIKKLKDEVEKDYPELLQYALSTIEDIRDALESATETGEVKAEDLPF